MSKDVRVDFRSFDGEQVLRVWASDLVVIVVPLYLRGCEWKDLFGRFEVMR